MKMGLFCQEITFITELPGSNFLLPRFLTGGKWDFQVANLLLATANFEPCYYTRMEGDGFVQFKAMIMTTSMHLMLLVFDILACDKLETDHHPWMFVFIPLMFMSIVSIGFCVWAIKNERSFEVSYWFSVPFYPPIFPLFFVARETSSYTLTNSDTVYCCR